MREKLPNRRMLITERLTFMPGTADQVVVDVSYGFDFDGPVKEIFCYPFKVGSGRRGDLQAACQTTSVSLQCGQSLADLSHSLGEDNEAEKPRSLPGLAVRAGLIIDDDLAGTWALIRTLDPEFFPIPKPATEAAAADDVEHVGPQGGQRRAFHVIGAEAGQTCAAAEPPQRAGAGLNSSSPSAQYDTGDNVTDEDADTIGAMVLAFDAARDIPPFLRRGLTSSNDGAGA